jgi:site-specific recombinase XerD
MIDVQADAFLKRINTPQRYSLHPRHAYANDVRSFVLFLRKSAQEAPTLEDFTPHQVQAYLDHQHKLGLQPSTLNRRRASLRRFARYLQSEGLIQKDPTRNITASLDAAEAPVVTTLFSEAEIQQLETAIAEKPHARSWRDLAILALLLETGLTTSRLVDLDLDNIEIKAKWMYLPDQEGHVVRTPIPESVPMLRVYIEKGRPELTAPDEKALFVSQMGGRMTRQSVWHMLRKWGQVARLKAEVSPRAIRHTAVSRMLAAGRTTTEIMNLLGHRNRHSTQALIRRLKAV